MRNIHFGSVYHMPWLEYRYALPDGSVCLRLQTGRDEFTKVEARVTSNYDMPEFSSRLTCTRCSRWRRTNGTRGIRLRSCPTTGG